MKKFLFEPGLPAGPNNEPSGDIAGYKRQGHVNSNGEHQRLPRNRKPPYAQQETAIFAPKYQSPEQAAIVGALFLSWTNFSSYGCRPFPGALWDYRGDHAYMIRSRGPDILLEPNAVRNAHFQGEETLDPDSFIYDPTNGTVSRGDIIRTKKE